MSTDPRWLEIALAEIHVAEAPGHRDNPRIVEYLRTTTLASRAASMHDETPWCSAFVNWCFLKAGVTGTLRANARSWLDWGQPLMMPRVGCVAVFSDPVRGPEAGHVAFYERETPMLIYVYGGNQHNRVCLAPYERAHLLGYRWPATRS
jgi:uncharacterized protein (TIGR02594 family)